jgi:hypothetical protein
MKKFEKVIVAAFVLLIVCLLITTCMTTPKAKVAKTPIARKTALKTSPIKNADSSVTYSNVKPNVFTSMKMKLAKASVQILQGKEGDIGGYCIKIHFKWDNATNLTIKIKDKPWYISEETVTG